MSNETVQEEKSYLEMSDEELSKIDPSTLGQAVTDAPVVKSEEVDAATAESTNSEDDTAESTKAVQQTDAEEDAEDASEDKEEVKAEKPVTDKPVVEKDKAPVVEPNTTDYKAMYEKMTAPFKASGREIAVKDVDDAIALMQMGVNYNKKMAALKPNLKLMKLLENNGMLSEERISFLIDLEKKSPEAISKLVKDSGIDPMDLTTETASEYKPNTYRVDDKEIELDTVLDEISGIPTYNRTLDIVSTKWDGPSKQVIAGSPQILKVINDHVQSGIYDIILKEVESERMFGRLSGLSDIEAYRKVGDAIQLRDGFAPVRQGQQTATKTVVPPPKPKVDDDKLRDKKRAASSTKPAGSNQPSKDFNPLALSDDDFSKMINEKFL